MTWGDRWRGFERTPIGRTILFSVGVMIVVIAPIVGLLPGPGGVFVFAAGFGMTLKYSQWVKRRYAVFKRRWPKYGGWIDWGLRRPSARRRVALAKAQAD